MASEYQSEIRESVRNALLEKVANKNYGEYLRQLTLRKVRGFDGKTVTFDFPVTALIGPNGGGKTTILGAAAVAYKSIKPRLFFAKSGKFDNSMQDWSIEYEIIDKTIHKTDIVRRTSTFKSLRWDRDAADRRVIVFGISRTIGAGERAELKQCISNTFDVPPDRVDALELDVTTAVERILGKTVKGFSRVRVDAKGRITLLAGQTNKGDRYSEFHFGAGESSIIRMVAAIESLPDNSLILIEEIENGLHPVATVRMVEYLIDVAARKKAQVIFTTHSNDALKPLPSQAIWAAVNNEVFQGKLDIRALRAIIGQIDAQLAVFVEDDFAADWVRAILRTRHDVAQDAVEIHALAGDGPAVAVNIHHNKDPSRKFPSVCFIDGDSKQKESQSNLIFRLPGESPEAYVFDKVMEAVPQYGGKLAVALLQRYEDAAHVEKTLKAIRLTNHDAHLLFSQVGQQLGLIPEQIVRNAFVTIYAQAYSKEVDAILAPITKLLPVTASAAQAQNS